MINIVYSTEHWIVPRIIIGILIILLLAIIVVEGRGRVKAGGSFLAKPKKFFIENPDFVKLLGTLVLFALYIVVLDIVGFTVTSMIFVFLFNILYAGTSKKSLITSAIIAVVSSILIAVAFGVVFKITLPDGFCTLVIRSLGITIY